MSSLFIHATATTEIYTLSLHDALPIFLHEGEVLAADHAAVAGRGQEEVAARGGGLDRRDIEAVHDRLRSEEHTSELQSQFHLVCRLLLEKKNIVTILVSLLSLLSYLEL